MKQTERARCKARRRIAISTLSQSPSLSGCLCENKSVSPSITIIIILAEVHKVDNPSVAVSLTHVWVPGRGAQEAAGGPGSGEGNTSSVLVNL